MSGGACDQYGGVREPRPTHTGTPGVDHWFFIFQGISKPNFQT
jgi:hypothetical protein